MYTRIRLLSRKFLMIHLRSLWQKQKRDIGVTELGATVSIEVTPKNFGRISAQKAKQVVVQKIREEERKVLYDQYYTKEKDIITGTVQRYSNGNYTVNIGKIDTVLTEQEQVKTERFRSHEKIQCLCYGSKRHTERTKNCDQPYASGTRKTSV